MLTRVINEMSAKDTRPYEHPSSRSNEREVFGLPEGTILLAKVSGFRVNIIDGTPFPEAVLRYGSANVKLGVQQIDEVITAVGVLLAKSS